jgi:hypothetical protein
VFFTDEQMRLLANEAIEVLSEDSRAIRRTAILPMRPGMGFVYTPSIAPDIMTPTRIWDHTRSRKLTAVSMSDLDDHQERWMQTPGVPEVWFPVSWDIFGIYPSPTAAGGALRVDYIAWPRALMDDDDQSELPNATEDALVLYGQFMGILKKWDTENAAIALKALQAHRSVADARSGISRMAIRRLQRTQRPHQDFPSGVGGEGT